MIEPRSALYALDAFGLRSEWLLWKLARGALGDICDACNGRGFIVQSPCWNREPSSSVECDRDAGCVKCRRPCERCRAGVTIAEVYAEDFGDPESRRIAEALDPALQVNDRQPRSNVHVSLR